MSYFVSAREAAQALGVPLLLRADPDMRAFRRHDRLGTLAAPAPLAARLSARARDEASRPGEPGSGFPVAWAAATGAIWVTGPWGSLAHLPWAVGLADQLARERGRAGLLEREPDGPLRTLAARGRRVSISSPLASSLLGKAAAAVSTDLEGVWILVPRDEAAPDPTGSVAAAGDMPVILADGLPEVLEGPYPGSEHVAGVILVAPFRDHSRFELDAVVRRLRETGHRLLGLAAIGPEVAGPEEAAPERAQPGEAIPAPPSRAAGPSVPAPTETSPSGSGTATVLPEGPPEPPEAIPTPSGISPLRMNAPPPSEPASEPVIVLPAPSEEVQPAAIASMVASDDRTSPADASRSDPGEVPKAPGPTAIPLFSAWDRQAMGSLRKRRRVSGTLLLLLALFAAAAFYLKVLRPLQRAGSDSRPSREEAASSASGGAERSGSGPVLPAMIDSTGRPADSTAAGSGLNGGDSSPVMVGSFRIPDSTAAPFRMAPDTTRAPAVRTDRTPAPGPADADTAARAVSGRDAVRAGAALGDTTAALGGGSSLAGDGPFVIHFSSFKLEAEADAEVATLRRRGIEARSIRVEVPERGTWYRIVTGDFATFAEAESVVLRLQAEGKIPYAHIAADGGRGQPVPVGTLDRVQP